MDIRTLLEDGTIHRAIEVLETNTLFSDALKKTIDSFHGAMAKQKIMDQRLDRLEVEVLERCTTEV